MKWKNIVRLEEAQENSQVKSFTNIEMLLGLFMSELINEKMFSKGF